MVHTHTHTLLFPKPIWFRILEKSLCHIKMSTIHICICSANVHVLNSYMSPEQADPHISVVSHVCVCVEITATAIYLSRKWIYHDAKKRIELPPDQIINASAHFAKQVRHIRTTHTFRIQYHIIVSGKLNCANTFKSGRAQKTAVIETAYQVYAEKFDTLFLVNW